MIEHLHNTVHCMDCIEFMKTLPDESIDMCLIDPPYNVGYKYNDYVDSMTHASYIERQKEVINIIGHKLKFGGSLIYITYPELGAEIYTYFRYFGILITPVEIATRVYNTNLGGKYLRKASRMCLWLSKGEPKKNSIVGEYKNPDDARIKERIGKGLKPKEMDWFYINQVKNVSKKHQHPCELPQDLLSKFILGLTDEGDTVLDCFAGSGSTGLCAKKLLRNYILCDTDISYCNIMNDRLRKEV